MSHYLKQIRVEGLPEPMGHYSDAVLAGGTLCITSLTGSDELARWSVQET